MNASPYKQISGNLIAASAGTGKTYQLTSRFVALLALGARPEKMIALTFTKKAAGEFRNRIFQALSDGALGKPDHDFPERNGMAARVWETWTGLHLNADMTLSESANPVALYPAAIPMLKRAVEQGCFPEQLTPMAGEPPLPQLTTNFFAELLMRVLSKSSDLQLSTLDSFFNRVVAADLHRAGLSSVTPMNALQQQRATRTALLAMLAESEKSSHHESALIALLSSIAEDKGGALLDLLENNVNTYLSLYKEFPEKAPWGNPIPFGLPDCSDAGLISDEEVEGIQREINELVESISWKKPRSYVRKTLTTAAAKIRKGEFKASDSFRAWLNEDEQYLAPDAEQERDGELRGLINYLNKTCAGMFLRSVQERSVAMHELLGKYYTAYRESILREGLCTFDDIKQGARQLLGHNAADEDAGMALNLTTKLDHWMLDEFQDTDPVQWEILSNLLKENAQYPDKSLFVVGDKKQSIYSFRGASAELFEQLRGTVPTRDGYDWQKHGLTNSSLKESRRSVPEIMKFTNLVFEGISEVDREFSQHSSHAGNSNKKGYVRVSVLPRNKAEQTLQNACRAIGNILEELTEASGQGMRRLKNGISVAILLRKGDAARSIVSWLRRYKPLIPVQLVEDSPLAEASPLGELLLSFFLWLREPADKYRYNVLKASPLGRIMQLEDESGVLSRSAVWDCWMSSLNTRGYAALIQELASYLPGLDSRRMLTEWLEEAVRFDAAGGSLDEWLLHMRTCCRKENGSARFVQVMTMHKSKGAEFDAVILPFLGSKAVDQPRSEGIPYFLSEAQEGILVHPGTAAERQFWPQLQNYEDSWKRARRNDSYNLMYVALTRARYANYLLLPEREKDKSDKESDWIQAALEEKGFTPAPDAPAEFGHADWYQQKSPQMPDSAPGQSPRPLGEARRDRKRISPSSMSDETAPEKPAGQLGSGDSNAADFGTRVHAAWEQITWMQESLPDWLSSPQTPAQQVVANALQQPEIAALFTCKPGQEVYNEQPIEAITDKDEWLSGTIDRLVITVDTQGKATAAHIIDFKTNQLAPDKKESYDALKKEYTAQMTAYREHVADALGLPESAITVSLLSCPQGVKARIVPC
ncbi:MAG: UvrD-helicase domain-containing protein [Akkermansia sp.]|nr:UvrD-helicase domain-containing protein [Akkermansia sp.]